MTFSPRRTRLQRRQLSSATTSKAIDPAVTADPSSLPSLQQEGANPISNIPVRPPISVTRLPRADHNLLLTKHDLLKSQSINVPQDLKRRAPDAASATLIFAQQEAGTAVCIHPSGLLLTCAHCIAKEAADVKPEKTFWLLFASGTVVGARCVAWDQHRDLALLRIVAAAGVDDSSVTVAFPAVQVADYRPLLGAQLVCIGHPGSEDFEAAEPGVKTGYDVLHLSTGTFHGYAEGQDLQDNSDIGALKHDCWTYWGHSGAPLLERDSGRLVGLHSSWDDETGMRRGIALEALKEFLEGRL
ncbi:hypothetical protein DL546_006699 [Coniochaeta pulveracea]|uniref:Serine protease n=1 Tax=Coniochaeta pulveracea TaxID=177199 RepID=A0A420YI55_9PEZI|nr:hypothetical protein DL546_006699 [Coniochaeta pulveracea]